MISESRVPPIDLDLIDQICEQIPDETWTIVRSAIVANVVDNMPSDVLLELTGDPVGGDKAEEIILNYYNVSGRNQELICDSFKMLGPENTVHLLDSLQLNKYVEALVECNPDICSGQPVFKGTRIPVAVVVGQLRAGVLLTELQEDFPQLSCAALDYAESQARASKSTEPNDASPCSLNT